MEWFLRYRPELVADIESLTTPREDGRRMLALASRDKLERILPRVFDPAQFLSDYGVRSLSRSYLREPYAFRCDGQHLPSAMSRPNRKASCSAAIPTGVGRSGSR